MMKLQGVVAIIIAFGGLGCSGLKTCPSDPSCPGHPHNVVLAKATCSATRVECTGWNLAADGSRFCDQSKLVPVTISGASGCFDSTVQTAAQACFTTLCSADYPFNAVTNPSLCQVTGFASQPANPGECTADTE